MYLNYVSYRETHKYKYSVYTTHNIIHIGTIYTYFIHIKYLITNKEEADGELGREKDIITNEIF